MVSVETVRGPMRAGGRPGDVCLLGAELRHPRGAVQAIHHHSHTVVDLHH